MSKNAPIATAPLIKKKTKSWLLHNLLKKPHSCAGGKFNDVFLIKCSLCYSKATKNACNSPYFDADYANLKRSTSCVHSFFCRFLIRIRNCIALLKEFLPISLKVTELL